MRDILDFDDLPPLPEGTEGEPYEQDLTGGASALPVLLSFPLPSGFVLEIRGEGNPEDAKLEIFNNADLDYIRALLQEKAGYPENEYPEGVFGYLFGEDEIGLLPDDLPEKWHIRKRGSLESVEAFLDKIPGWQSYFSVFYDILEREYLIYEHPG